jgi:hypothetical protein
LQEVEGGGCNGLEAERELKKSFVSFFVEGAY